jgi:hypothetical protein
MAARQARMVFFSGGAVRLYELSPGKVAGRVLALLDLAATEYCYLPSDITEH